jgi:hypothetical protein
LENRDEPVAREAWAVRLLPLWAALLAMAPFLGVLAGQSELFHDDHFRFSTPIAAMFAEAVRGGHLPLWNPWILTGTPLVAERGSMVAHPGMFLALVMAPSHAVGTLMVLLLGVLAAGATALLRALSVRPVLAVAMGAALGLSGPALSYTSNAPFLGTLAFWPLVLLFALRLAQGKGSVWGGGLALGMALLGGDLPGALLAALVALLVFRAGGGNFRAQWPRLLATGLVALVVGAGSWYPVVWALPISERGAGIAASEAGRWSFHPAEVLGFLWPHPLGLPLPRFTFWAYPRLGGRLFLHSIWVGSLVSAASVLALRRGGARVARVFILAALVLLAVATGEWTPLWVVLRPVFTFLRYPSKLAGPAALLVACAGAVAVERLLTRPRGLRNLCLWVAGLGALGAIAGPLVQSLLARKVGASPEIVQAAARALRLGAARVALLAAAGAAMWALVERKRLSLPRATSLFALLLLLDVFSVTADLVWTRATVRPVRPAYLSEAREAGPRGPRVMRLAEVNTARLPLDEQAASDEQLRHAALLAPMTNVFHHASVLEPYGLYVGEVAAAMAEMTAQNPLAFAEASATDLVLAAPGSRAGWLRAAVAGGNLVPVAQSPAGAVVLRPAHALPRSFLTNTADWAPHDEIPRRLIRDTSRVLVSQERGLRAGTFLPPYHGPHRPMKSESRWLEPLAPTAWRPGEASYQTAYDYPSVLVEMDAFTPGWRVYVDGEEKTILQVNAFGRGVPLWPGKHTVTWRFCPRLVVASLLATWIALGLGVLALVFRRRQA